MKYQILKILNFGVSLILEQLIILIWCLLMIILIDMLVVQDNQMKMNMKVMKFNGSYLGKVVYNDVVLVDKCLN